MPTPLLLRKAGGCFFGGVGDVDARENTGRETEAAQRVFGSGSLSVSRLGVVVATDE